MGGCIVCRGREIEESIHFLNKDPVNDHIFENPKKPFLYNHNKYLELLQTYERQKQNMCDGSNNDF